MNKTVYFRAFEDTDADLIYQFMNDDSLKELSVGLNRRMCMDEAREWVKARKNHNPYQAWFAICAIDSNKMIGYTSLSNIHYINRTANFSGIVIADEYHDGFAWMESYLFIYEYGFERLGLNKIYGESLIGHKISNFAEQLMYMKREGIHRQEVFKNGNYYDLSYVGILKNEYFEHKDNGDFEYKSILQRLRTIREFIKSERNK